MPLRDWPPPVLQCAEGVSGSGKRWGGSGRWAVGRTRLHKWEPQGRSEAPPWDSESHLQADEGSVSRQRNRQCDGSKTQVHPVSLKNSKQEGQASSSEPPQRPE